MAAPVSVRLDDDVRATLEAEARARHIGLRHISDKLRSKRPPVCGGSGYVLKAVRSENMLRSRPRRLRSTRSGARPGTRTNNPIGRIFGRSNRRCGLARRVAEGAEQAASCGGGRG